MKDLTKIGFWIINSFIVGMGVYIMFILIEAIFKILDGLENVALRIIFFTVIGGIATAIFRAFNKKEI